MGVAPPATGTVTCVHDCGSVTMNGMDVTGIPGSPQSIMARWAADNMASGSVIWYMHGNLFATGTWKAKPKTP